MADISQTIIEGVLTYINQHKTELAKHLELISKGTATYTDANNYAVLVGEITQKAIKSTISGDMLPNNRMYYNIANKVVPEIMRENFGLVNDYSKKVQAIFNAEKKIPIAPIDVDINKDKIKGLVDFVSDAIDYDKVSDSFTESIINFNQATVADNIKENAHFQYKSGIVQPYIKRVSTGKCCAWCNSLAGTYPYKPDMDTQVFRRHTNCRCMVLCDKEGTKRYQNAHTKKWIDKIDIQATIEKLSKNKNTFMRGHVEDINDEISFISKELNVSKKQAEYYYNNIKEYSKIKGTYIKDAIDEYIKKAPKWNGGTTYRGIRINNANYGKNDIINVTNSNFASWSSERKIAEEFAKLGGTGNTKVIFICNTQKNGTSIKHLSVFEDECEVLSKSEIKYKVTYTKQYKDLLEVYLKELNL